MIGSRIHLSEPSHVDFYVVLHQHNILIYVELLSWDHSILRCWVLEILKKRMENWITRFFFLQRFKYYCNSSRYIYIFLLCRGFPYGTRKRRMRVAPKFRILSPEALIIDKSLTRFAPNQDILRKRTISTTKNRQMYWKSE